MANAAAMQTLHSNQNQNHTQIQRKKDLLTEMQRKKSLRLRLRPHPLNLHLLKFEPVLQSQKARMSRLWHQGQKLLDITITGVVNLLLKVFLAEVRKGREYQTTGG